MNLTAMLNGKFSLPTLLGRVATSPERAKSDSRRESSMARDEPKARCTSSQEASLYDVTNKSSHVFALPSSLRPCVQSHVWASNSGCVKNTTDGPQWSGDEAAVKRESGSLKNKRDKSWSADAPGKFDSGRLKNTKDRSRSGDEPLKCDSARLKNKRDKSWSADAAGQFDSGRLKNTKDRPRSGDEPSKCDSARLKNKNTKDRPWSGDEPLKCDSARLKNTNDRPWSRDEPARRLSGCLKNTKDTPSFGDEPVRRVSFASVTSSDLEIVPVVSRRRNSSSKSETLFEDEEPSRTSSTGESAVQGSSSRQRNAIHDAIIAATFRNLDVDNTGYITQSNLRQILGADFSDKELAALIKIADPVNKTKISYESYAKYLRSGGGTAMTIDGSVAPTEKKANEDRLRAASNVGRGNLACVAEELAGEDARRPSDDYDPRKSEYNLGSTLEELAGEEVRLLGEQILHLEMRIRDTERDSNPKVVHHYSQVLAGLRRKQATAKMLAVGHPELGLHAHGRILSVWAELDHK